MAHTMRYDVLCVVGPDELDLVPHEIPAVGEREVLVQGTACIVDEDDVHAFVNGIEGPVGRTVIGWIVQTGTGVSPMRLGELVVYVTDSPGGATWAVVSQDVCVPARDRSERDVLPVVPTYMRALHALRRPTPEGGALAPRMDVVVIGADTAVGRSLVAAAALSGPRTLVAVGHRSDGLNLAVLAGASQLREFDPALPEQVAEITEGHGPRFVYVAGGSREDVAAASSLVGRTSGEPIVVLAARGPAVDPGKIPAELSGLPKTRVINALAPARNAVAVGMAEARQALLAGQIDPALIGALPVGDDELDVLERARQAFDQDTARRRESGPLVFGLVSDTR